MWYQVICPFEGASGEGSNMDLYIEWSGEFDMTEVWEHVLEHQEKIDDFYEHSIDEKTVREVGDVSEDEIEELVGDMFNPDYALFEDGRVYYMKYIGDCRWVSDE